MRTFVLRLFATTAAVLLAALSFGGPSAQAANVPSSTPTSAAALSPLVKFIDGAYYVTVPVRNGPPMTVSSTSLRELNLQLVRLLKTEPQVAASYDFCRAALMPSVCVRFSQAETKHIANLLVLLGSGKAADEMCNIVPEQKARSVCKVAMVTGFGTHALVWGDALRQGKCVEFEFVLVSLSPVVQSRVRPCDPI